MTCGYNLTGNVSGACPECGTLTDGAVSVETTAPRSVLSKSQLEFRVRWCRALLFALALSAVGIVGYGFIQFHWYSSSTVFEDVATQLAAYILFLFAIAAFDAHGWYLRLLKAHGRKTCMKCGCDGAPVGVDVCPKCGRMIRAPSGRGVSGGP